MRLYRDRAYAIIEHADRAVLPRRRPRKDQLIFVQLAAAAIVTCTLRSAECLAGDREIARSLGLKVAERWTAGNLFRAWQRSFSFSGRTLTKYFTAAVSTILGEFLGEHGGLELSHWPTQGLWRFSAAALMWWISTDNESRHCRRAEVCSGNSKSIA
jgi:hypothetical protein